MPMKFIGKVLFPRLQPWQRQRQLKTMLFVTCGALLFATLIAGVIIYTNHRPH